MPAMIELPLSYHDGARAFVSTLVGIRYVPGAATSTGCDCVGLVCLFYELHGAPIPHPVSIAPDDVEQHFRRYFRRLESTESPMFGDMVTMWGEDGEEEGHVGIWTPDGILHATRKSGVVLDRHARKRVLAACRYAREAGAAE